MWTRFLTLTLLIGIVSTHCEGHSKRYDLKQFPVYQNLQMLTEGGNLCDLVSPTLLVIPCRYFDEMPIHLPPVEVDCGDLNTGYGDGDVNRCTNVV